MLVIIGQLYHGTWLHHLCLVITPKGRELITSAISDFKNRASVGINNDRVIFEVAFFTFATHDEDLCFVERAENWV